MQVEQARATIRDKLLPSAEADGEPPLPMLRPITDVWASAHVPEVCTEYARPKTKGKRGEGGGGVDQESYPLTCCHVVRP